MLRMRQLRRRQVEMEADVAAGDAFQELCDGAPDPGAGPQGDQEARASAAQPHQKALRTELAHQAQTAGAQSTPYREFPLAGGVPRLAV